MPCRPVVQEPGRAIGIDHRGMVTGSGRFTLRRRPGGRTRFTWNERLTFPWWMGGPVGEQSSKPIFTRLWRANLARLRAKAESHPHR